jgi:hypothetical protein
MHALRTAGVILIAAVFAGMMFRHRQQSNQSTLPITTMATATVQSEVFSETLEAETTKLPNRHL